MTYQHRPRRPRVAVWAYACNPAVGSDPGATWGYVHALSTHADVVLLHSPEDADDLRGWKADHPDDPIELVEVAEPRWASILARGYGLHRQLRFITYQAWLRHALARTREEHRIKSFDAVSHASYGNYWFPSPIRKVGLPTIWGPIGGGVRTPARLWPTLGVAGIIAEVERSLALGLTARLPGTRQTQRAATVVVVETEETRRRLRRDRRPDAVVVNRAAIIDAQTAGLGQGAAGVNSEPGEFLFTSALWGKKGTWLALAALRFADPRARLAFVNHGYEQRRLERLAQRWGVEDRVRFLGRIPRDELFARMRTASGLVFTGLREEGGVALAEAMRQGLPVVVLDHGGAGLLAEEALDPRRVQVVPPGSPRATARKLGRAMTVLLADPSADRSSTLNVGPHLEGIGRAVRSAIPAADPSPPEGHR